jgi:hypothetical protein
VVAGLLACAGVQLAGASRAGFTLTDPAGDSGTALDITSVIVDNDGLAGNLTFTIPFPNETTLRLGHRVALAFDTDGNPSTGTAGADYLLGVDSATSFRLLHSTAAGVSRVPSATASVAFDKGVIVHLNRHDLGNPSAFQFVVETIEGSGTAGHFDLAPNSGRWTYTFAKPVLQRIVLVPSGTPTAGKAYAVAVTLAVKAGTTSLVPPTTLACQATVGGAANPTRVARVVIKGALYRGCSMSLKSTSRGKTLVLRITVTSTAFSPPLTRTTTVRLRIA